MIGYEYLLTVISPMFSTDPNAHVSSIHRRADQKGATASLTPAPLIAGSLARTISATVISPIEMFRTRLQALPTNGRSPTYATTFRDMGDLVRGKGLTVLWRGLGPTLWRDVPFSGTFLVCGRGLIPQEFTGLDSRYSKPIYHRLNYPP